MTTLLCLDPGLTSVGYAVLRVTPAAVGCEDLGVIRTQKSDRKLRHFETDDTSKRVRQIARVVDDIAARIGATAICLEHFSRLPNARSGMQVSRMVGAIEGIVELRRYEYVTEDPMVIKQRVCGSKTASKDEVQFEVLRRFGNQIEDYLDGVPAGQHVHAYDAAAVGIACLENDIVRALRRAA